MEQKKYPITNAQKNIYLIENYYKGTPVNNVCGTCLFHSVLNFNLLRQALYMMIQNNDSFKMHLDVKHGEVFQYLDNSTPYNIEIVDVADMSDVDSIENDLQKKVYNVFSKENTFDIKIFKFPNNQGGYVIQIHHLFSDSWTLGLVAHKVAEYYNLLLNEQHELDSEKKFSYIDYIDDKGSVWDRSEGALIDAGAALDALGGFIGQIPAFVGQFRFDGGPQPQRFQVVV